MTITISHAPRANLATANTTATIPVAVAPNPLMSAPRRQPDPPSRSQWTTMPARAGMNPSRARSEASRGKSAKAVFAARTRMPIVENWRM